ncbi:hypothetical protein IGI04_016782, partial [Brassica rapa subsp. trilocularis]
MTPLKANKIKKLIKKEEKHRLASSVRRRRPASSLPRVKHRDALSSIPLLSLSILHDTAEDQGLGLLRVSDWKMALIMRLGLEVKEGLLLWWLSRGMTENLFRWKFVFFSLLVGAKKGCFFTKDFLQMRNVIISSTWHYQSINHLLDYAFCLFENLVMMIMECFETAKRKLEKSMVADNDSEDEFCREIELLARLHHRHLVALKGFCAKKNE